MSASFALVDKATGFQQSCANDALARILENSLQRNRARGFGFSRIIFALNCSGSAWFQYPQLGLKPASIFTR
jgi:hypothetical protein